MMAVITQSKEINTRGKHMTLTEEDKIIHCDSSLMDMKIKNKNKNGWK